MKRLYPYLFFLFLCLSAQAQEFKVYQFPADKVPAIDGNTHDRDCVPADYKITEAALKEDEGKHAQPDTTTLKVSVKVGWCAETQKLYFLYEAYDNYWRFSENSLNTDIFEVVVDGDCSGGRSSTVFIPQLPKMCGKPGSNFTDAMPRTITSSPRLTAMTGVCYGVLRYG